MRGRENPGFAPVNSMFPSQNGFRERYCGGTGLQKDWAALEDWFGTKTWKLICFLEEILALMMKNRFSLGWFVGEMKSCVWWY